MAAQASGGGCVTIGSPVKVLEGWRVPSSLRGCGMDFEGLSKKCSHVRLEWVSSGASQIP